MRKDIRLYFGVVIFLVSITALFITSYLTRTNKYSQSGSTTIQTNAFETKPNIVLIVTDDQRWDTLQYMSNIQSRLVDKGITFVNSFVSTPNCCPYRASLLSGGYHPYNTGVLTNSLPNGGAANFDDENTLAVKFQKAGYRTALFGKYLNKYQNELAQVKGPAYIPPGWDSFNTIITRFDLLLPGNISPWSQFDVVQGTSSFDSPSRGTIESVREYYMDYYKRKSISFLQESRLDSKPFLLILTPIAPHDKATPSSEDANSFDTFTYRGRGYDASRDGKPSYVQKIAQTYNVFERDQFHREQLESLQSVDRAVGDIVDTIDALGLMDNTLIIFTSDNGYMWGEHGLTEKNVPYEESIRVPLVIAGLNTSQKSVNHLVATNLDLGETLLDIIGESGTSDGQSLVPFIQDSIPKDWKSHIIFQNYNLPGWFYGNGSWVAIRDNDFKYVYYPTDEEEFYDLRNDPYEIVNQISNPEYSHKINIFKNLMVEERQQIGLMITNSNQWKRVPDARIGINYAHQLHAIGGNPPLTWNVIGSLPDGIQLDQQTGLLYGNPSRLGEFTFNLSVSDSSNRKSASGSQKIVVPFTLNVQSEKLPPPVRKIFQENFENIGVETPLSSASIDNWVSRGNQGGVSFETINSFAKNKGRNSSRAMKLISFDQDNSSFQMERDFGELYEGNVTVRFYDSGDRSDNHNWGITVSNRNAAEFNLPETRSLSIGYRPEISKSNYVYKASIRNLNGDNIGNDRDYQWIDTGIAQTEGWHTVSFWVTRDGAFALLDNQNLRQLPVTFFRDNDRYHAPIDTEFTSFRYLRAGTQNGSFVYLDDIVTSVSTLPPTDPQSKIDFSPPEDKEY